MQSIKIKLLQYILRMGRIWYRLKWMIKAPFRRRSSIIITSAITYLSLFNLISWYVKEPGSPLNRFHWRLMKGEGRLSQEMLMKEKTIEEYYDGKFKSISQMELPWNK